MSFFTGMSWVLLVSGALGGAALGGTIGGLTGAVMGGFIGLVMGSFTRGR